MPRLGDILVTERACPEDAVRDALRNQIVFGGRLGTNLLEAQAVREEALARALGRQHGVACLFGDLQVDGRAIALLGAEAADRLEAVPYVVADRRLAVLVVDPGNASNLEEIAVATGKRVQPIVAPEARVWALLRRHYALERPVRGVDAAPGPDAARPDAIDGGRGAAAEAQARRGPSPDAQRSETAAVTRASEGSRLLRRPAAAVPEDAPLTFAEAVRLLDGVGERDAIARTVLRYARSRFRRAVLFTVDRGGAHGWSGVGEKLGTEAVQRIHLPLGAAGVVDTVVTTQAHFLGPVPKTPANIRLLKALGGGVPANAFVVPILALGRVVNVFYADNGRGEVVDASDVGELLILATRIAQSYGAMLERVR